MNKAISPHYLTKVRDTEFYDHIIDLGKIREGNFPVCTDVQRGAGFFNKIKIPLEKYFGTLRFPCQIVGSAKSGARKIREDKIRHSRHVDRG